MSHTFPAQGQTVDRAHVIAGDHADANGTYVAITRARESTRLYVGRERLDVDRDADRETQLTALAQQIGRTEPEMPSIAVPLAHEQRVTELADHAAEPQDVAQKDLDDVDQAQDNNLDDVSPRAGNDGQDLDETQDRGGVDEGDTSPGDPDDVGQAHDVDEPEAEPLDHADVERADVERADDGQAQLVGDELAAVIGQPAATRLEADARARVNQLGGVDDGQLAVRTAAGRQAWAALDREGARETLAVQHRLASAEAFIAQEQQTARRLLAQVDQLPKWPAARKERGDLRQAADKHQHDADQIQGELPRYLADEKRLRDDGRHLDDWLREHRPTLVDGRAAELELTDRDQVRETWRIASQGQAYPITPTQPGSVPAARSTRSPRTPERDRDFGR